MHKNEELVWKFCLAPFSLAKKKKENKLNLHLRRMWTGKKKISILTCRVKLGFLLNQLQLACKRRCTCKFSGWPYRHPTALEIEEQTGCLHHANFWNACTCNYKNAIVSLLIFCKRGKLAYNLRYSDCFNALNHTALIVYSKGKKFTGKKRIF